MSEQKHYSLAIGYKGSHELEQLRAALNETNIEVVSYDQDAQRVFDNAMRLDADVVLLSPECTGYRTRILQDLLYFRARPIPVIGWGDARSDSGRHMLANGAAGYITLPLDGVQISKFITMVPEVVERELQRRAEGDVTLAVRDVVPDSQTKAWQSKVIVVYVPKGGGSHRTTTAINLSVVLSHLTMGNQPTVLLDFDQTKGDCHTMLGYVVASEVEIALERNLRVIERGLFDLVVNSVARYPTAGVTGITIPFIRNYMVDSPAVPESQLDLLPGLMHPADGGSAEFQDRQIVLDIASAVIQQMRRVYAFTVIDIGQDFSAPLHEAAIREADDVLVLVPPMMTAILDTRYALRSLREYFGDLDKFHLLTTGYDPSFGITEKQIVKMVGLPLACTVPFDPVVAGLSINTHTPYVLNDHGPLGNAMRALGATYLPHLAEVFKARNAKMSKFSLKRLFIKQS
jgi:Flp pilus assembly CpaE family ATPase